MQDILSFGKGKPFKYRDKLERALESVERQVRRGIDITDRLNRFAHTMDEETSWVEINDILDQVLFLMDRFARSKQVVLTAGHLEGSASLRTSGFQLILTLSTCMEHHINQMTHGGRIRMCPETVDDRLAIRMEVDTDSDADVGKEPLSSGFPELANILRTLDAELLLVGDRGQPEITLVLPLNKG
jgi:hypothetical protein